MVADGAMVIAPRPVQSPSLTDYPQADQELGAIASAVWGAIDGKSVTEHSFGKGKMFWGNAGERVLDGPEDAARFSIHEAQFRYGTGVDPPAIG